MKLKKIGILFGVVAMIFCGMLACQSADAGYENEEGYVLDTTEYDTQVPVETPVLTELPAATEIPDTTSMVEPTAIPTIAPTAVPTIAPTVTPTATPTVVPTATPTATPTVTHTVAPTTIPTAAPTTTPTAAPTVAPTAISTPEAVREGITAGDIVDDMIIGWNLGNSLDSWIKGKTGLATETSWHNPVVTKKLIDTVKAAGFNTVRVPVTWYNHMDENNVIDPEWLARVEEVVNYVLDNDMYCILNVHHDTGTDGWLKASRTDVNKKKEKFETIWIQVADYFGDYGDRLLFEGFNEILNEENEWVRPDAEAVKVTNELNQIFVDTVRSSEKEKNKTRVLVVNTYCAGGNKEVTENFVVPTDTVSHKLIVGAHIYQPYYFTTENSPDTTTWKDNKSGLDTYLKNMYTTFANKGIPVIISEFGAVDKNNKTERQTWLKYYVDLCERYGIKCIWWDNGGVYKLFDRTTCKVLEPELIDIMVTEAQGGDYVIDTAENSYVTGDKTMEELLADSINLCADDSNWNGYISSGKAKGQISPITNGRQIFMESPGENPWDAQLSYKNLTLKQGAVYRISFDYTGTKGQSAVWNIIQNYGGYGTYCSTELVCNGEIQHFETEFKMEKPTDNNTKITFDCGTSTLSEPYTVQVQNLIMVESY